MCPHPARNFDESRVPAPPRVGLPPKESAVGEATQEAAVGTLHAGGAPERINFFCLSVNALSRSM
jgi:hypothetical protein